MTTTQLALILAVWFLVCPFVVSRSPRTDRKRGV